MIALNSKKKVNKLELCWKDEKNSQKIGNPIKKVSKFIIMYVYNNLYFIFTILSHSNLYTAGLMKSKRINKMYGTKLNNKKLKHEYM